MDGGAWVTTIKTIAFITGKIIKGRLSLCGRKSTDTGTRRPMVFAIVAGERNAATLAKESDLN